MGNDIFGVDVAGIIMDTMGGDLFPVTVTREVKGARETGNLTGPRPSVPTTFECIGFWEDFTATPPGIELQLNDRKLVLIGDSIPDGGLPLYNDTATVHEDIGASTLYVVRLVKRDPAAATYQYLCRDRRGPDKV